MDEFSDQSNPVRIAFVQAITGRIFALFASAAEDAGMSNVRSEGDIVVVIISVEPSNKQGGRRRRLLQATTNTNSDGVEIAFSVTSQEVQGADEDKIASDMGSFMDDTTSTGFSATLPADAEGKVSAIFV